MEAQSESGSRKMWMTDTRTIVMLLMLGVSLSGIQQVAERLDTLLTGGTGFYVGQVTWATMALTSVIFFGPMGFITGTVSAIISTLTATSPGAWYWIPDNLWIGVLLGYLAFRWDVRGKLWPRIIWLVAFMAIVITPIDYAGLFLIMLKLPLGAALVASLPYVAITFLAIPLAYGLVRAIEAAKLID